MGEIAARVRVEERDVEHPSRQHLRVQATVLESGRVESATVALRELELCYAKFPALFLPRNRTRLAQEVVACCVLVDAFEQLALRIDVLPVARALCGRDPELESSHWTNPFLQRLKGCNPLRGRACSSLLQVLEREKMY